MINDAETRIRAERRMGEMLRDQEMNKGGKSEQNLYRSHGATSKTPTLAVVGITKSMSSRAQMRYTSGHHCHYVGWTGAAGGVQFLEPPRGKGYDCTCLAALYTPMRG